MGWAAAESRLREVWQNGLVMPAPASSVLVVSTPSIEGCPVTRYAGFVTARAVLGAGVLKDMGAWFSDMAGGRAGGYEAELESATETALDELRRKAEVLGANCVLSVSVQTEAIGGKSLSMLAVAAEGTAVVVDFQQSPHPGVARAVASGQARPVQAELGPFDQARLSALTQGLREGRFAHPSQGMSPALGEAEAVWHEIDALDVLRVWLGKPPVPLGDDEGLGAVSYLRAQGAVELARALARCGAEEVSDAKVADALMRGLHRDPFDFEAALELLHPRACAVAHVVALRLICELPIVFAHATGVGPALRELEAAVQALPEVRTGSKYSSRARALELLQEMRKEFGVRAR
mgnify:CR=1 FL=1